VPWNASGLADARIENLEHLDILVVKEGAPAIGIRTLAEISNNNRDFAEVDASVWNLGPIDAQSSGFPRFAEGIVTTSRIDIFTRNSRAEAFAEGGVVNDGDLVLRKASRSGIGTILDVEATGSDTVTVNLSSALPSPSGSYTARASALAEGSAVVENTGSIQIESVNLSGPVGISTRMQVESQPQGAIVISFPIRGDPDETDFPDLSRIDQFIETEAQSSAWGSATNSGSISITREGAGFAYGIRTDVTALSKGWSKAEALADGRVRNEGDIFISASGDSNTFGFGAQVVGISTKAFADLSGGDDLENASMATQLIGNSMASVENRGWIRIFHEDGADTYGIQAEGRVRAQSVLGQVESISIEANVTNTGEISVFSSGSGDAYGISTEAQIQGDFSGVMINEVRNFGAIEVSVMRSANQPGPGDAVGIHFENGGSLHSEGLIDVFSEDGQAHQVVTGGDLKVSGYAMRFGLETEKLYSGTIRSDGIVSFDDAVLFVSLGEGFEKGLYELPELVDGAWVDLESSESRNQFSSFVDRTNLPDMEIKLIEAAGSLGQRIDIRYAPPASFASKSMRLDGELLGLFVDRNQRRLLGLLFTKEPDQSSEMGGFSDTIESSHSISAFHGAPFYMRSRNRTGPVGVDASTAGMQAGYTKRLGATTQAGLIGGYAQSRLDFRGNDFDRKSEDADHYFGGLHASHRWSEHFGLSATSVYFSADKEYSDASPLSNETAVYSTQGLRTRLDLAYWIGGSRAVQQWIGGVGLSHTWQDRGSFTTKAASSADVGYSAISEHYFVLHAGLDWQREYIFGAWRVMPQAAFEMNHVLGNHDFTHKMSVGNLTAVVTDQEEKLNAQSQIGVSASHGRFSFGVGILAKVGKDSNQTSAWLSSSYSF
jgi:hypothetical protein